MLRLITAPPCLSQLRGRKPLGGPTNGLGHSWPAWLEDFHKRMGRINSIRPGPSGSLQRGVVHEQQDLINGPEIRWLTQPTTSNLVLHDASLIPMRES